MNRPSLPIPATRLSLSTMAESATKGAQADDDYMGDISQFLPSQSLNSSNPFCRKKIPSGKPSNPQSFQRKSRNPNWKEQRRLGKDQKQYEEDEQTLAKIEDPIPQSNIGFKLLQQMGYTPGSALGKEGAGRTEPVGLQIRRSRAGIGREDPIKEKRKREETIAETKRMTEEALMEEFGTRQKSQWRSRRIVFNFDKAKAALDRLENKEYVQPEKNDNEERGEQVNDEEEEEEEIITEEDLENILTKLRDEHLYCLFCGCQYESMESLVSSCPGINEDDH